MRVLSDIYAASDRQNVTLLGLLDLSAAFDCVDHDILAARLRQSFGICSVALTLDSVFPSWTDSASLLRWSSVDVDDADVWNTTGPVSYTHLTLPTIYSV